MVKTIFAILSIFIFLASPVFAQDSSDVTLTPDEQEMLQTEDRPVEIKNSPLLEADLVVNTQNPSNKSIKFDMLITSSIDTDRLRVTWTLSRNLIPTDENKITQAFGGIKAGQEYTVSIEVTPGFVGVYEIEGKAVIVGAESSALATVRKNFAVNGAREMLPITSEYKQKKLIETIKTVFLYVLLATVLGIVGYLGWDRFKKWYAKD